MHVMPIVLWSLITIHQSKQHKPNVVGVHNLVDLGVWCGVVLGHINDDVQSIIVDMV
jgi:hypothetical protein